jgi:hypothetical protein
LLDLRRFEDVVGVVLLEDVRAGAQVQKLDRVGVEPQRPGVGEEVVDVLFEVDEQCRLAGFHACVEKVQPEDGLAGSRRAVEHVAAAGQESTSQNFVESVDTRRQARVVHPAMVHNPTSYFCGPAFSGMRPLRWSPPYQNRRRRVRPTPPIPCSC